MWKGSIDTLIQLEQLNTSVPDSNGNIIPDNTLYAVIDAQSWFRLDKSSTAALVPDFVVQANPVGRWLKFQPLNLFIQLSDYTINQSGYEARVFYNTLSNLNLSANATIPFIGSAISVQVTRDFDQTTPNTPTPVQSILDDLSSPGRVSIPYSGALMFVVLGNGYGQLTILGKFFAFGVAEANSFTWGAF